jgi:hypothetical protein
MWDLRVTFDEGPRFKNQWIQAIFIGPKAFRRRSKTKKWQIEAKQTYMAPIFEGKSIGLDQKKSDKKQEFMIWRTKESS